MVPAAIRVYVVGLASAFGLLLVPLAVSGPDAGVTSLVAAALAVAVLLTTMRIARLLPVAAYASVLVRSTDVPAPSTARLVDPPLFPVRPRAPGLR